MTQATFDRWLFGAGALVALLTVAAVSNFQYTRQLNYDAEWVAHTHQVIGTLQRVIGHLHSAAAIQRSYIIVGGSGIPAEFKGEIESARQNLRDFTAITSDNRSQQDHGIQVQKQIEELESFWAQTMTVRNKQGFDAAREIVESGQSRRMMDAIRDQLLQMDEVERNLLKDRSKQRENTYRSAAATGILTAVAAIVAVIGFMLLMRRHMAAQTAAAAVIAQQSEQLRTTLTSIGDAVITTGVDGCITGMNPVAESLTGWTLADAAGRSLGTVFHIVSEETRQEVASPSIQALSQGTIVGLANHTILIARDGTERPIDDSAAPIRGNDGQILGCVLVFRDVSERRRLEREMSARHGAARLLASIVESSEDAIISKSLDGIIQSWNAAAERIFGYSAQHAVGKHISLIIPADRLGEENRIIASLQAGQRVEHFETVRQRSDGRLIDVSLTISPVRDDAGRIVGASKIARDITDSKLAEADRQKFVTLVENSSDFIGICDLQGAVVFVNRAGLQLVGLDSIEQARRIQVREFFFPEDQSRIKEEFFPSVLEKGQGEIEIRFRHFKTGQARWMSYKVLTLTDSSGQPVALATVSQDVTERRSLEVSLRKLADDLSDADRRKDEFLATLAHELRNPLAPIRNALQIISVSSKSDMHSQAHSMMQRQLEQMVRLIDDLLDVSRISRGKLDLRKERVALSAIINSAIETSRPMIDRMNHTLSVTMPTQELHVDADLTRLAQVVSNLLNNSAKYMDRGGHIWLTVQQDGGDVVISVRDKGIGITADHLPHIFEMFAQIDGSLERAQGGLGIGLTLVKRLVEMHGGRIEARSEGLGAGAEFIARMPIIVEAASPQPPREPGKPADLKSSLRILIVDDNRDSATSLAMLLKFMGNDTRTAFDGEQGFDAAAEFRPNITLLDIGLPKLNGYETCRLIRQQPWGKDIVLIAITGWGHEDDRRRSQEAGFDRHMVKPVNPHELMKLVAGIHRDNM